MKLICVSNEEEMSLEASRLIAALVRIKPDAVLGLATGSTPLGTYEELVRMHGGGESGFFHASGPSTWMNTSAWTATTRKVTGLL